MPANSVLLVYQLKSVDRSPAQYQMSSTIKASLSREGRAADGYAFNAMACGRSPLDGGGGKETEEDAGRLGRRQGN